MQRGLGVRPQVEIRLDCVRERVHPGGRRDVRRQALHELGIERGSQRHDPRIDDRALLVQDGVGEHRGNRHFRAGARRRGHDEERQRRLRKPE